MDKKLENNAFCACGGPCDCKIEILAEFMGWEMHEILEYHCVDAIGTGFYFDPPENWNDCMLVEARLREKGLWNDYIDALYREVGVNGLDLSTIVRAIMLSTKEQRMEAAVKVIGEATNENQT